MFATSARSRFEMHFDWLLRQLGRISSLLGTNRAAVGRGLAVFLLMAVIGTAPARAASFNWGSATCITGAVCNTVGSVTRFSNAVGGSSPRDILLEVVGMTNGATVNMPAAAGTGAAYIDGRVLGNSGAGQISQVHFRLRFVTPGTTTDAPMVGPVYFSSLDTDGLNYHLTGGFRERIEFITPPARVVPGPQLEAATPLNAGGMAFRPIVCTDAAVVGCNDPGNGGVGTYVFYPLLSLTTNVAATAVYLGAVTTIDFAFGLEISAAGPGIYFEPRQYGIAGGVPDADMVPSAITCTPSPVNAGLETSCALTCTNNGPDVAIDTQCGFTGTLPAGATVDPASSCGTVTGALASGASRTCRIRFTPTTTGTINLTGGTGATNDTNGGTDMAGGNNPTSGSVLVNAAAGADVSPVFSGLPTVVRPGQTVPNLTLTCTNAAGGAAALGATCTPSVSAGTIGALTCTPAAGATLAAGASQACTFSYTAPGTAGGTDEPVTGITFTGTATASNDSTAANNTTTATAVMLDAVDESTTTPAGVAASLQVLTNDTRGTAAATFANVSISVVTAATPGSVFDPTLGAFSVPATAASGTYTVTYQLCASPAVTPAACDTATATIVVGPVADMAPVFGGLPSVVRPGQTFTGLTLTCSNAAGASPATAATCAPQASAGTVSNVVCTPLAGSTVAGGASLRCTFDYQAPGTPGGARETVTAVTFTGDTGASNDGNAANNRTTATAPLLDAVDDGPVTVPPAGSTLSLIGNDVRGGTPVGTAQQTVTLTGNGGLTGVTVDAGGQLVVPAGTPPGTYTLTYQLCASPATTPATCDSATVTLTVLGQPDLQVSKTHSPATFTERQRGTYTITARNTGTFATSLPYTVVDTLPAGMTVAAVPAGTGWDCSATTVGATTATCTSGTPIAAGASGAPITLVVDVAANACAAPDASGVCSVAAGTALVNQVAISGGGEPGTGTSATNNTATDPTPVQKTGAISGRVWLDADHDRQVSGSETGVAGMAVEVVDASGTVVGTALTDASGNYRVDALAPGSGYGVRFRDPVSGAYYGRPISNDPDGGNDPSAASGTGVVTSGVIRNVTVPPGTRSRINQSLPLDPSGVVYASDSRGVLGGVRVDLLDAVGNAVAGSCVVGGASSVVTASSGALAGAYSFLLVNPAPGGCPGAGTYQLRVTPTAGYVASTAIPAQAGTLTPPTGCSNGAAGGVCTVQAQNGPPTGSAATTYYLSLRLDPAAGPDIVNNHVPLDPSVAPALAIVKTGDRTQAEVGDSVRYTVTVRRTDGGGATLPALEVIDTLPAGFRYIDGTAQVNGVAVADPAGKPGPVLRFALGAMAPGSTLTLSYRVRLGVGSQQGSGINSAQATGTPGAACGTTPNALCSNVSQFRVKVLGGVFSTDACVVGKVFVDCNHNHVQDAEELGIPGVRLYLTDGTSLISDVEGKYSLCGLPPRTHVLVVDQTTLPRGSRLTTSSNRNAGDAASLFLDLKNGELHRADVIEGSCSNTVLEQVKARRARGETQSLETEKRGGRVLKFDGKPVSAPPQATDSARQRGDAAGRGEPGAVKPRQDGGVPARASAVTDTVETIQRPLSANPASSGQTVPRAEGGAQ